jgi:hypothetical protein
MYQNHRIAPLPTMYDSPMRCMTDTPSSFGCLSYVAVAMWS